MRALPAVPAAYDSVRRINLQGLLEQAQALWDAPQSGPEACALGDFQEPAHGATLTTGVEPSGRPIEDQVRGAAP
jgi:hypothetical protein